MSGITQLNRAQQDAVRVQGHCLITACPGSGKTTVLVHRAIYLLSNNPATTLVGVTFNAEAANELRRRILEDYPEGAERVICGTFHSLSKLQIERAEAARQARNNPPSPHDGQRATVPVRLRIVDENERDILIRRALALVETSAPPELTDAKEFIDRLKSQVDPLPALGDDPILIAVFKAYQKILTQMEAYDFSDLIIKAVKGMSCGEISTLPCDFLLADEFQDADPVQLAWIMAYVQRKAKVTVVGDDDQSIYAWRHAGGLKSMMDFKKATSATHVELNLTYRCAREIMTAAARLITKNNDNRVHKSLETAHRGSGTVRVRSFASPRDEAQAISSTILSSASPPHTWAVLARSNHHLDIIDTTFRVDEVPYYRMGGISPWEMPSPALFLSLCTSLARGNLRGIESILRCQGISEPQLAFLRGKYRDGEPGALRRFLADPKSSTTPGPIGEICKRIEGWERNLADKDDKMVISGIRWLIEGNARTFFGDRSEHDVIRDKSALAECYQALAAIGGSLNRRLIEMQAREEEKKQKLEGEDEIIRRGVTLLTLHASKGLEYPNVWIIGCRNGMIPSAKSSLLAEERRLFYVGMTRAESNLTLSYVIKNNSPPSPFLKEAGLL